ncbi:MAG: hypothetical protein COX48_05090 [bacterium (Candidatus Stahlbacteria) CG23_combo_of_CG06-09_8_20_14_all_34_7]|nr:MAG: hypothetical protein COX48_05090 [bacterium (Candidatus Stahlbacteria) CG23_combo_of_CG06-09_8_20_14_all_34_7]
MIQKMFYIISSCFFIGNLKGGGTIISFIFCIICFIFNLSDINLIIILFIVLLFSVISIEYSRIFIGDDSRIVADELIGIIVSLLFLPKSVLISIAAFILFRYFDIAKPLFIKYVEKIKGPAGIILDDVISALAANVLVRIIIWAL